MRPIATKLGTLASVGALVALGAAARLRPVRETLDVRMSEGLPAETAAPALRISAARGERPRPDDDRALSLVLASMTSPQIEELVRALNDLADRLEIRANPLVEDLDDASPEAAVHAWLSGHLPALTAARTLAQPAWETDDGTMVVTASARCGLPAAPLALPGDVGDPSRCIAARGTGTLQDERARFSAWPITRSIVLRAPSPDDALQRAEELRRRASPVSLVALVLQEGDARRRDTAEEAAARAAARRVVPLLRGDPSREASPIVALARDRPTERLFPDVSLSPSDVLVVPKLSALAKRSAFAREVDVAQAQTADVP